MEISEIFAADAAKLLQERGRAIKMHESDIRASGNQVEIPVRNYLSLRLPRKYYVGHGHLIDRQGTTSSQLDLIISDNDSLPSLLKADDGTEYIPYDSVYSIGEIKSTYYKSDKPISSFGKILKRIQSELHREELPNTVYSGITNDSLMRDLVLGKTSKVLNKLFSFIFFLDKGDFTPETLRREIQGKEFVELPNIAVILNYGIVIYGAYDERGFSFSRYPDQFEGSQPSWYFCPFPPTEKGTLEGNHLAFLYYSLVQHLSNSYLEPPSLSDYVSHLLVGRKSQTVKI